MPADPSNPEPSAPPEPRPDAPAPDRVRTLIHLFHHRWSVPILGELDRRRGAKFVTLVHATGAAPGSVRASLDALIARGWVAPNPGYGHPLRPEYILTDAGAHLAPTCARLDDALVALDLRPVALRKWSMPVLDAVAHGAARFTQIATHLRQATDRAVSLSLQDLQRASLLQRVVDTATPALAPMHCYTPTLRGSQLSDLLPRQ